MNYIVSDCIIRLKNAVLAVRKKVVFPYSVLTKAIGNVLVIEGFLTQIKEEELDGKKMLVAEISYVRRIAQFSDVKIISKPSLRIYARKSKVFEINRGLGVTVLSTNKGIMTGKEALQKGVGGEILFKIW